MSSPQVDLKIPAPYAAPYTGLQEIRGSIGPGGRIRTNRCFRRRAGLTATSTAWGMAELIYHSTVREVRKTHRNAIVGLLMNVLQTVIFISPSF